MKKCLCTFLCISMGILLPFLSKAQLTADFSSNMVSGCSPILVQFSDQSTGGATSWSWNLGNGTTSSLQNPSTTYINPGFYTVSLTVSDGNSTNIKTMTNYIQVIPTPVVNFTASDSGVSCPPKTIQFTDASNPGASGTATYLWDFGDGNTSALANPVHTYQNNGNFNVTLSIKNASGCSQIITKNNFIQMISRPQAGFTASNNNSCSLPLSVNFTNASSSAVSYFWDFGDGTTSTSANPNHTYTAPGSYTVKLIAKNSAGCTDTVIKPAFVNIGTLTASFSKSASVICTNNMVSFTNTSQPGAGNSTWYFGDGTSFNGANASHIYTAPGIYTVKLVVHYNNCSDSVTQSITVNQGPATAFTANPVSGCKVPFTTQFTNTTSGANGFLWLFGDGATSTATSPSHTYTALGVYNVTLISFSSNGCSDTLKKNGYINISVPAVTISKNQPSACAPSAVNFTANVPAGITVTGYSWNFGDGTTGTGGPAISHVYNSAGTYSATVTITTSNGCTITSSVNTVKVGEQPTAGFTASDTNVCPLQLIGFTNTSAIPPGATATYSWNFGDGATSSSANPTHAYGSQGNYTVTLTVNINGCKSTFSQNIVVNPPKASFTVSYNCTNKLQVSFTNTSAGGDVFAWDFGDGSASSAQNPLSHTYGSFGTYNVKLTVTNLASGCVSVHTVPVVLFEEKAAFSVSDSVLCKKEPAVFTAASSPNIAGYTWIFGDGNSQTTTANTVSYAYSASGNYTVTLIIKDIRGCYDTLTKNNYIHVSGPAVNFSGAPVNGCAPLSVQFTDQSIGGTGGITGRTWRFGDGAASNANAGNVSHVYTSAGTFSVTLVVTNGEGCQDSLVKTNYITATKPKAGFSTVNTNICPGQAVNFSNSSVGSNLSYHWDFGDGSTSGAVSPSHIYGSMGTYTVRLIAVDAGSCRDTLVKTAYINVGGINLSFSASDTFATCPPLTVNFSNSSSSVSSFSWDFGNGNTSTLSSPTTVFTMPGNYTVKLKGQNGSCMDSVTKNITVLGPTGTFNYLPVSGCMPLTIQFSSTNQNTQQLIWDMDNGVTQTTTGSTATYTYTVPGIYIPKLLLSDGNACIVPILGTDTIKVEKLEADFSFSPEDLCSSGTVQFKDTVLQALNPIASISWDFGDGTSSNLHNPSHFYQTPGTYQVQMIMTTSEGCTDTVVKTVQILLSPVVHAGNNVSVCAGDLTPVSLQATGAVSYAWTPVTSLSCTNCPDPQAIPSTTTVYTVVGTAANGCTDTAQVTVTVNPLPVLQTIPDPDICEGASAQLVTSGASTYSWTPAAGLSCTSCASPTASPASTATYIVTGTSAAGCSDTAQITVHVNSAPVVSATSDKALICAGETVQMQATGAQSYIWTPATGLSCSNCPNPTVAPSATTTYIVTGFNSGGCTDTAMVAVTVEQLPQVSAGLNQSICKGSSAQLQAAGATSYSWSPAIDLSCSACPDPVASPLTTTIYTLTGTSAGGCVNTSQVTVQVNDLPVISAGNDQTACKGISVSLQASGAVNYSWLPAASLSCSNCSGPFATPDTTTTYTVIGSDANGCKDTAQVSVHINPLPEVNAGEDQSVCTFSSVQLQATGANTYSWTPSASLSCNNCSNPLATPSGPTTYTVTGTDANGCKNTDQITISIYPQPEVNAGKDQTICFGTDVQLMATGAQNYLWTPASGLSCTACPDPNAGPESTRIYTVTGTDINGCSDTDDVKITVIQKQPFSYGDDQAVCEGASAQLSAAGGEQFFWSPVSGLSSPTVSNPVASPDVTTTYTVIVKQGNCFEDTGKITVTVHPKPTVSAGPDQKVIAGTPVSLFANASHTDYYQWTPSESLSCSNCMNPVATPDQTTTYTVGVSNVFGCKAKDEITVFITCDNSQIFLANTFTPNGDGNNDRFYPQGKGITGVHRFRIYNRWGELLYDVRNMPLNDELTGWDGTYKGEPLRPDVYVYILDASCTNGEPMQLKGDISLIR